jgi:hypothetical protein
MPSTIVLAPRRDHRNPLHTVVDSLCVDGWTYALSFEKRFDLTEELFLLFNMGKVCGVLIRDPFNLGYTIKERLHCRFLHILL